MKSQLTFNLYLGEDLCTAHSRFQNQISTIQLVKNHKISKCFILQKCSSSSIQCSWFDLTARQRIQKSTTRVQGSICSMVDCSQYRGAHHRCKRGTLSAQRRMCNTDQLHHQYGSRCTVQDYQNHSGGF